MDTTGQLDVLGHDCDTLGMDGTQVGVFKETNQVSLRLHRPIYGAAIRIHILHI